MKQLFTTKQKNSPTILKELTYNVLEAPEPEELTVLETFPHVTWNDGKFKSAIPNPESCPVLSCSPHHDLYGSGDSPSIQCNNDSNQLQSLAEDLVRFANITNPNELSSQLQSEYESAGCESASEPYNSGNESSSTLSSIPLGQRSPRTICDYHIDNVPNARNSSTDLLFLDASRQQSQVSSKIPQLPSIPKRNQSVLTYPTGICHMKTIKELESMEDNLDDPDEDDVFSPPENYPFLFNFTYQPLSSQNLHHEP